MAQTVLKIKKGDTVKGMSGKEKGKTAKISRVLPQDGRVVLEGLFLVKKFVKPKKAEEKGQIVQVPRAIDASNVMIVCKHCGKPTRVGYSTSGSEKARICKRCGAIL